MVVDGCGNLSTKKGKHDKHFVTAARGLKPCSCKHSIRLDDGLTNKPKHVTWLTCKSSVWRYTEYTGHLVTEWGCVILKSTVCSSYPVNAPVTTRHTHTHTSLSASFTITLSEFFPPSATIWWSCVMCVRVLLLLCSLALHLARTAHVTRQTATIRKRGKITLSDATEEIKHMNSELLWCDRQGDTFGATDWWIAFQKRAATFLILQIESSNGTQMKGTSSGHEGNVIWRYKIEFLTLRNQWHPVHWSLSEQTEN